MSKGKSLLKNTIIIAVGKISTQFITFFLLPLYTGFLTTSDFGIVDLLNTLITLLIPLLTLQIEQGIFRYIIDARTKNEKPGDYIKTAFIFVGIQITILSLIFIISLPFVKNEFYVLIYFNLIATVISSIFLQIIRGMGDNISYSIASLISGSVSIILNVIFIAFLKFGAHGMLAATLIANVMVILFLSYKCDIIKIIRQSNFDKNKLKQLIKYSIPLIPNSISWWVINVSDRSIISFVLGVSFNGIYAVCNKVSSIITTLFNIFYIAWVENVSLNHEASDFKEYFIKTSENIFLLFSIICSLMISILPIVFPFLINESYSEAYYHIPILILAMLFNVLQGLYGAVYVAKKESTKLAHSTILGSIINIFTHLLLINYIGLYAASISTFLSYFIVSIFRLYYVQKQFESKINVKIFLQISILLLIPIINYYYLLINHFILIIILIPIVCLIFKDKIKCIYLFLINNKHLRIKNNF